MQKFGVLLLIFISVISCKNSTKNNTENTSISKEKNANAIASNYDWTGTYELKDINVLYTLKLHKRSVDASYEMQFFSNDKNADLLKSSIYDAKDDAENIYIKFLNNFNMDAKPLGFTSGDTLFVLHINTDKKENTIFKTLQPKNKNLQFTKTSNLYN